jgi:hypothetical protein
MRFSRLFLAFALACAVGVIAKETGVGEVHVLTGKNFEKSVLSGEPWLVEL